MKVWLEKKFFMSELKQISIMHFSCEELKDNIYIGWNVGRYTNKHSILSIMMSHFLLLDNNEFH